MIIQLDRPLCVFDLETTGLDISKDRIVQIAILKIHPDGKKEELNLLINPEMNISESNSAIHGITNEIVKDAPTFKQAAKEIAEFIGESDMAGYNSNKFDIPVLAEEFLRVEFDFDLSSRKCVDVQNIFHKMEQRTLVAAFKFYCSKELDNAHDAMADTTATWEVFEKQIERYGNLKPNIDLAFSRRLQSVIHYAIPNSKQRKILWRNALNGLAEISEKEIDKIAKSYEISGGSIKNVIQFAWLKSKSKNTRVTLENIMIGIRRELSKDGKSFEK